MTVTLPAYETISKGNFVTIYLDGYTLKYKKVTLSTIGLNSMVGVAMSNVSSGDNLSPVFVEAHTTIAAWAGTLTPNRLYYISTISNGITLTPSPFLLGKSIDSSAILVLKGRSFQDIKPYALNDVGTPTYGDKTITHVTLPTPEYKFQDNSTFEYRGTRYVDYSDLPVPTYTTNSLISYNSKYPLKYVGNSPSFYIGSFSKYGYIVYNLAQGAVLLQVGYKYV